MSLPKYRTSGRIKEFAFVEFADKGGVENCINAFRQFDGVICDTQDAEHLKSVEAYVKEQEELENEENCPENAEKKKGDGESNADQENNVGAGNKEVEKAIVEEEQKDKKPESSTEKVEAGSKRPAEEAATNDVQSKRVKIEEPVKGQPQPEIVANSEEELDDDELDEDSQSVNEENPGSGSRDHKKKRYEKHLYA